VALQNHWFGSKLMVPCVCYYFPSGTEISPAGEASVKYATSRIWTVAITRNEFLEHLRGAAADELFRVGFPRPGSYGESVIQLRSSYTGVNLAGLVEGYLGTPKPSGEAMAADNIPSCKPHTKLTTTLERGSTARATDAGKLEIHEGEIAVLVKELNQEVAKLKPGLPQAEREHVRAAARGLMRRFPVCCRLLGTVPVLMEGIRCIPLAQLSDQERQRHFRWEQTYRCALTLLAEDERRTLQARQQIREAQELKADEMKGQLNRDASLRNSLERRPTQDPPRWV